ncbi:MAG: L-aspartate oxidase [Lentisphaerae bacterium RIFOXYC12_FULL_60_16]|nr:MAG: L-aspartate oxidase [Lentisphaerae bacterium RIFOXYC12_FULL_60_16]OGV69689.1 MAG: L-aspartate oxidase [Lentisphaerae bacterium RIFOXYA12_FULL_60_10]OGV86090.1 MAG: L-aspartate oxidase [Lentisphaerae bacterium RIFOXYB12_FULL_60_10]
MKRLDCDYFVVGSGMAGLMAAIKLSAFGSVVVCTKKDRADSSTNHAQGGVACVMDSDDSIEAHVQDTLRAGAGLCRESVVRAIVGDGPARIAELEQLGVHFAAQAGGGYDLGREGGHTRRRVLHAGDITGRHIETALLQRVHEHPGINLLEHCMLVDLVTTGWLGVDGVNRCVGAYLLDRVSGEIFSVRAPTVVLATGGGGKVYLYTSNPDIATGDGVAVAWRAGVPIANLEFIQFHPTCLYHPDAKSFLISEAVRGEGARLVDASGQSFMERYDPQGALAPRDIVARAIDREMKVSGSPCMYLDIRHRSEGYLRSRFPNIYEACLQFGIDMARHLIPVVPAAHYFCGGIEAGVDGETELPGLLAIGEVACTGLHGANRLASNSLLEALVCARRLADRVAKTGPGEPVGSIHIPDWQTGAAVPGDEAIVVEHNWNEVRTCLWDYVGIVRTDKRLARAWRRIRNLRQEIRQYYLDNVVTADILELRNIADVGELIVRSAQLRHESRGLHYTLDYPGLDASRPPEDTVIRDPAGSHL